MLALDVSSSLIGGSEMKIGPRFKKWALGTLIGLVCCLPFLPRALASAPGPVGTSASTGAGTWHYTPPDPKWLALKEAHRIRSGIRRGDPKGTPSHPYVASSPYATCCGGSPPQYYELSISTYVNGSFEPSDGTHPNFGTGTSSADDANHAYFDHDFFDLCGAGAADNALWYWPNPPNLMSNTVTDNAINVATYWSSERMRGYMTYLAWDTQWPGWPHRGMMDNSTYPSNGISLYGMVDGLNWEASGRNPAKWSNYFYAIQWWNSASASILHNDIVTDTYFNNVAIVAEVDASLMPNWPKSNQNIHHYITIVGYDDTSGVYYYTDTCANSTGCGSLHDATVQIVSQSTLWSAITAIPVNTSTSPAAGDGGWVW